MSIAVPRKRVVILVLVHKPNMNPDEVLSFRQCISILGAHDIVVVCPADMNVAAYKDRRLIFVKLTRRGRALTEISTA
jgi:hypothetical protein